MTNRLEEALAAYDENPMAAGDVALLMDDEVCVEVAGLADHWDAVVRGNLAEALRAANRVHVLVARPDKVPLISDHVLWAELREELLGSGVEVLPLHAVPASRRDRIGPSAS